MRARFLLFILCNYIILNLGFGFSSAALANAPQASSAPIVPGEVVIVTKTGFRAERARPSHGGYHCTIQPATAKSACHRDACAGRT